MARAGGSVDLTMAGPINNVRRVSGTAAGDFRLINADSVSVPAGGVAGDSLVAGVGNVTAGPGGTLDLAIWHGDITVDAPLHAPGGLVMLRRVAGATGSEIILNGTSFSNATTAPPNMVMLDLSGSPTLSPGNEAALKSSTIPANGTSPIATGPNQDGTIVLNT